MIIRGFIKEVGQTRDWTTKEGEKRQSVRLTLQVPYVAKDGQERNDELMGEINYGNPEFLDGLKRTQQAHERCEMTVGFSLSEWKGKMIQNIRIFNLTKMI